MVCHKLNMSQQCHCCENTFHRNQNSLLWETQQSRWLCCLQVTWRHTSASLCSRDLCEIVVAGLGHWASREKVGWLSWLDLRLLTLKKVFRRCDHRLQEICSLYSWCKKLKFNQVSGTRKSQMVRLGRFGLDSLRGYGVCLTAFNNRQVRSLRFMVSLVPFGCFLWIRADVTALLNHCLSVNESHPLAVLGVSYAS